MSYTPRYTADVGNPELKPTTADQLDLTYEWYFSNTGSFTAALFYKKFNDYIDERHRTRSDFTNNGVTRHGQRDAVRSTVTARSIKGFEVAYQTFFDRLPAPWNGFGIQANFTYVDNQGVTNCRPVDRVGRRRHAAGSR